MVSWFPYHKEARNAGERMKLPEMVKIVGII